MTENGLLRRYAPLRKRFAFVAGNDERPILTPSYFPPSFATGAASFAGAASAFFF
jgi:hypothetical protein